ncbi:MAG: putative Ig domain-containing protein [Desulfobacterales bacterium]|nr:putative Ig domain-containing protein [Desulfobacterales bacterium]
MKFCLSLLCSLMILFAIGGCNSGGSSGSSVTLPSVSDQSFSAYERVQLALPQVTRGKNPITYTLTPSLPEGLSFNPETRTLSGTPSQSRTKTTYTLTARDADGGSASSSFGITITPRLAIHTRGLNGSYTIENTADGGRRLDITQDGATPFAGTLSENLPFNLEITSQPLNQTCIIPRHFKATTPSEGARLVEVYCGTQRISSAGEVPSDIHPFVSPDGSYIVYRATPNSGTKKFLTIVSLSNGNTSRLTSSGAFENIAFTPDGSRIVYTTTNSDGKALYSLSLAQGAPIRLSGYGEFKDEGVRITPDGSRVLYLFQEAEQSTYQLYAAPILGGTPTRINQELPSGKSVNAFYLSPNGAHVIYAADKNNNGANEFYRTTSSGGSYFLITPNRNQEVARFDATFTKTSGYFVYSTRSKNPNEFFSFNASQNKPAKKISPELTSGQDIEQVLVTPDGTSVLYHLVEGRNFIGINRIPIEGGTATRIISPAFSGNRIGHLVVSPDSSTVLFDSDRQQRDKYELFAVPVLGGPITKLNRSLENQRASVSPCFLISPNSRRVVYRVEYGDGAAGRNNIGRLYSVPVTGGTSVELNGPLSAGRRVTGHSSPGFQISPDSSRVVYVANQDQATAFEMYSVPIEGGRSVKVNGALPANSTGFGGSFEIDPRESIFTGGGSRVVYTITQEDSRGNLAVYLH